MSEATATGQVHLIEPVKAFGQKGFKKRSVVLTQASERFTNYLPFDFCGGNADLADKLAVGDTVKITYRLSGRKWQKDDNSEVRFFLGAEATDWEVVARAKTPGDVAAMSESDLPF